MFQKPSTLKHVRDALSSHMELPEYFLGIHAFFDGEVIFARDVVQVNMELSPFPVDFDNVWDWFREQLKGLPGQETFAYATIFGVEDEEDPVMETLIDITVGSSRTIWMIDLADQNTPSDGRRFVVVTAPDKKDAQAFRDQYHGKDAALV